MANFDNFSLLEIIEEFAEEHGFISSEEELSKKFDDEVVESVIAQYGCDDQDAIDQAFNDWTDSLCTDGDLHSEQYSQYAYVGKYAGN